MVLNAWLTNPRYTFALRVYGMLPRMLVRTASATLTQSATSRVLERCELFQRRAWTQIWELSEDDRRRPPSQHSTRGKIMQQLRLIRQGELGKAVRVGTSRGLFELLAGEESAEVLASKFPQQDQPTIPRGNLERVMVDDYRALRVVMLLGRCCAADRFGWRNEHYQDMYKIGETEATITRLISTLLNSDLPEDAAHILGETKGCALQKPGPTPQTAAPWESAPSFA
jgi:hypothetical protein